MYLNLCYMRSVSIIHTYIHEIISAKPRCSCDNITLSGLKTHNGIYRKENLQLAILDEYPTHSNGEKNIPIPNDSAIVNRTVQRNDSSKVDISVDDIFDDETGLSYANQCQMAMDYLIQHNSEIWWIILENEEPLYRGKRGLEILQQFSKSSYETTNKKVSSKIDPINNKVNLKIEEKLQRFPTVTSEFTSHGNLKKRTGSHKRGITEPKTSYKQKTFGKGNYIPNYWFDKELFPNKPNYLSGKIKTPTKTKRPTISKNSKFLNRSRRAYEKADFENLANENMFPLNTGFHQDISNLRNNGIGERNVVREDLGEVDDDFGDQISENIGSYTLHGDIAEEFDDQTSRDIGGYAPSEEKEDRSLPCTIHYEKLKTVLRIQKDEKSDSWILGEFLYMGFFNALFICCRI